MSPYARLAALAERRADLAAAGAWDDAEAVARELDRLAAALPPVPPAGAAASLELALLHTQRAEAAFRTALDGTRAELGALGRGRRLVAAYRRA